MFFFFLKWLVTFHSRRDRSVVKTSLFCHRSTSKEDFSRCFCPLTRDINTRICIYIGIPEWNFETGGLQTVFYFQHNQISDRNCLWFGCCCYGVTGFPEVHLKAAPAVTVSFSRYFTSASGISLR